MQNERLREIREKTDLTQKELALKIGISQPMLSQVERGDREFDDAMKVKVANLFNVTVEWLFFEHLYCETQDKCNKTVQKVEKQ